MLSTTDTSEVYFEWLLQKVGVIDPFEPVADVLRVFYESEFHFELKRDYNRYRDALGLRDKYRFEFGSHSLDPELYESPATFLEFAIELADKFSMQVDFDQETCFWHMMRNVGIEQDGEYSDPPEDVVDVICYREFGEDGFGGFFPREEPETDQREVEFLYQMYNYVVEFNHM